MQPGYPPDRQAGMTFEKFHGRRPAQPALGDARIEGPASDRVPVISIAGLLATPEMKPDFVSTSRSRMAVGIRLAFMRLS